MKYGNFVGGGWLPISKEEQKEMREFFKAQLEKEFGKEFFKGFSVKGETKSPVKEIIITARLATPFNGRNKFKETCKDISEICFFITKDKGKYLEIQDEKHPYDIRYYTQDTENCPPFSYGCHLFINGFGRPYRAKHWGQIQHWSPYNYGTEINDLQYSERDLTRLRLSLTPINAN